MGRDQPSARRGPVRRPPREGRRASRGAGSALRRRCVRGRRSGAPHRRAGASRASPYHALFAKTMFITPDRRARRTRSRPDVVVLHAPEVEADPAADGTRSGTFVVLHPTRGRGADRRHVLRRRDQEGDLHGDERPAAARGRPADALLGERRRGRQGRGLLRPLRHGQDDAVGRPGALADRRRRARLGRRTASSTSRAAATRR